MKMRLTLNLINYRALMIILIINPKIEPGHMRHKEFGARTSKDLAMISDRRNYLMYLVASTCS